MHHIWSIAKKELQSSFNSPLAYLFIDVFLIINAWLFFQNFFLINQADMRSYFSLVPWMFLFLIPAITMRLWAEEKKLGTVEVLLTMPVRDWDVVLGKFLGSLLFLMITLTLSFAVPAVVMIAGDPEIGVIAASYVGSLFLGASYIAIGLWVSALTDNQIVAYILTVALCFLFFIIGEDFVVQSMPSALRFFSEGFQMLGLGAHFKSIVRGVMDSRDVIFYLSFIGFFLYLNARQIAGRRFR